MDNANNIGAVKEVGADYGENLNPYSADCVITYSVYPAFWPAEHLSLISRHVQGAGYRFFMVFSGRVPSHYGSIVVPPNATLINETCAEWPVDHARVRKLLDSLQNIQINLLAGGSWGCDGEGYELEYKSGFTQAEFHWWCELPAAWSPLGNIVDQFLALGRPQNEC